MDFRTAKAGDLIEASDGRLARVVHEWSDEKLFYVERYMDIFTRGMGQKWKGRLTYLDFFSGPGLCIDRGSGQESEGSPLRSLRYGFGKRFFNDLNPTAVAALHDRVALQEPSNEPRIENVDCNDAVSGARSLMSSGTLGLAFIDPTAYQMTFESIERLTRGLRMDLIITFMTNYPRRFIGQPGFQEGSAFDEFMGTRDWLKLGTHATTRQILDLYEDQLRRIGYEHVVDDARILNSKNSTLYHLVFASKHPRGEEFFKEISRRTYSGQRKMQLG